jgi:RNA polymerase sigma factor (sigma-70 family)
LDPTEVGLPYLLITPDCFSPDGNILPEHRERFAAAVRILWGPKVRPQRKRRGKKEKTKDEELRDGPPPSASTEDDLTLYGRYYDQGDQDALGELFKRHYPEMFRLANRLLPAEADANDVVSTAFGRVVEFRGVFQGRYESSFRKWLLKIVRNVALDHKRRAKVRKAVPLLPGHREGPEDAYEGGPRQAGVFAEEIGDVKMAWPTADRRAAEERRPASERAESREGARKFLAGQSSRTAGLADLAQA